MVEEQGPDFTPDFFDEVERAIYDRWVAGNPGDREVVARIARLAAGFIAEGRASGWSEADIRDYFMGMAHDWAALGGLPENRGSFHPRNEFLAVAKAAYRWGLEINALAIVSPADAH